MLRASDGERFYQCLTCVYIEICNLDEKSEDERGMCKEYCPDKVLQKKNKCTGCRAFADNAEIISII